MNTFWISADKQASLDMGNLSEKDALEILLGQCGSDEEKEAIHAGSFRQS